MSKAWSRIVSRIARAALRAGESELRRAVRSSGTPATGTASGRPGRTKRTTRRRGGASGSRPAGSGSTSPKPRPPGRPTHGGPGESVPGGYLGDFTGVPRIEYRPDPDGDPDPGEVVWAWVPYEEDHTQGKDRPVLLIGHDGPRLLGLMLSSQDNDRNGAPQRGPRRWMDLGTGAWDRQGRPSEVRLDRVLALDAAHVRREGAQLDRARFDRVTSALRELHGWR